MIFSFQHTNTTFPKSTSINCHNTGIKSRTMDRQIIAGVGVALFTAIAATLSSKFGMGLLSFWPVAIVFMIVVRNYELGLICFVLSFAYQAPVVFAPKYGLSAFLRLDELVFIPIFLLWLLRNIDKNNRKISPAPLTKPLLFYSVIAFLSLLARYDSISSTAFLQTASGLKGLIPLFFKLSQVVLGYIILTDARITEATHKNLLLCLPIVAAFAVTTSFLISQGLIPKDIVTGASYDPYDWYTRLSLFGNTSAWGVLLIGYFFILLYSATRFKPAFVRFLLLIALVLSVNAILMSGTKTSIIGLGLGLLFLVIKGRGLFGLNAKIIFLAVITITAGFELVNRFATESQKENVFSHLNEAYIGTGIRGFDRAYSETSLGTRYEHWLRFGEAIEEEPILLLVGRGWHRRVMYETGICLHNDWLTACHDLGILGVVFVTWLYVGMFRQFSFKRNPRFIPLNKDDVLQLTMQASVLVFVASSFASENLTLYGGGSDVQFPFIIMLMAVTWGYLKKARLGEQNAII